VVYRDRTCLSLVCVDRNGRHSSVSVFAHLSMCLSVSACRLALVLIVSRCSLQFDSFPLSPVSSQRQHQTGVATLRMSDVSGACYYVITTSNNSLYLHHILQVKVAVSPAVAVTSVSPSTRSICVTTGQAHTRWQIRSNTRVVCIM
jgi:hypothetical protein